MKNTFSDYNTLAEWEIYFHDVIYNPDYKINDPIGTIESELNNTFTTIVRAKKNLNFFWLGLFNTFSSIPPKEEYRNTIYSVICFLENNVPNIYRQTVREIITKGRFTNLKRSSKDEFDFNDLLLDNLISETIRVDQYLENILDVGIAERKPYYYYLLSKYYFNIGKRKKAVDLLTSLLDLEESSLNIRCYSNCLYALDENIPTKINWIAVITEIATNEDYHNSKKNQWQYSIFQKLIQSRAKEIKQKEVLTDSEVALILLYSYFTNDGFLYGHFSYEITEFENKYPDVKKLSNNIFSQVKPVVAEVKTIENITKLFEQAKEESLRMTQAQLN